jgi:plasmid stabilization system protein ParE
MRKPLAVRFTLGARSDLNEIFRYIAADNPAAADAVLGAVREAAQMIADFPRLRRRTDERGVKALALGRYPYLVFFRVKRDQIDILRVRHGARRHPGFQEEAAEFIHA